MRGRTKLGAGVGAIAVVIGLVWLKKNDEPTHDADIAAPIAEPVPDQVAHRIERRPGMMARLFNAPSGDVTGKVVDATTGDNVPFVDVIFSRKGLESSANSGNTGTFGATLGPGLYAVRAVGEGVVGVPQPKIRVAGKPIEITVRVTRLGIISGRVVDHKGKGIAGAAVEYVPESAAARVGVTFGDINGITDADANGRFELSAIAGERAVLQARVGTVVGRAVVEGVAPAETRAGIVITIERGARVEGRVTNPRGQPIPRARVHVAVGARAAQQTQQMEADEDGWFAGDAITPGPAVIEARASGYAQSVPLRKTLKAGDDVTVHLRLQASMTMKGKVFDQGGTPVAGARVWVGREKSRWKALEQFSDSEGRFSFDNIDAGPHWVTASKTGFAVATAEKVRVTKPARDLVLTLSKHGGLRGTLASADGGTVSDFVVTVKKFRPLGVANARTPGTATRFTRAEGRFQLMSLAPGTYDLELSAGALGSARVDGVQVPPGGWIDVSAQLAAPAPGGG